MASLELLQRVFHKVLRQELSVEQGAIQLGTDAARLDIYREFVENHVREALSVHFPILRQTLSAHLWESLGTRFFRQHPPQTCVLSLTASPLPGFLATEAAKGCTEIEAFHISLGQFEWEQFSATTHLAEIPPRQSLDVPIVNPTLSIMEFACPVVEAMATWFNTHTLPAELPSPADGPEMVLFFRDDETYTVRFWRATEDLLWALKIVHDGITPEETEQAQRDTLFRERVLDQALEIGLLIGPTS